MTEKRSMAELKSLMGLKDIKGLKNMNNEQWEAMYSNDMLTLEQFTPFKQQIENPPYRYQWVLNKTENLGEGTYLDIGCNNGALTHLMSCKGFAAIGIDASGKLLENCVKNVPKAKFVKGFADQEIPFPSNHFKVISALEVLEHVQNPEKMVQEMIRVLKPNGKLLVTVPVDKAFDCPQHLRYFDFYTLGELFEPFTDKFTICKIYKSGTAELQRKLFALEATK